MKNICVLFILSIVSHVTMSQNKSQLFVLSSAKVYINGKTNVNSFKCKLEEKDINDTLQIAGSWNGNKVDLEGLNLRLSVDNFDCGLGMMTKDFRDFMMSERYPEIYLKIDQLIFSSNPLEEFSYDLSSVAFLTLAEQTRTENIDKGYLIQKDKSQVIGGTHHVRMTSFGLTPPTKFLGTVKVQDELSLEFELVIRQI